MRDSAEKGEISIFFDRNFEGWAIENGEADKFWQRVNAAFRHKSKAVNPRLNIVSGAGGELARVFGAAAWALVSGPAAWSGVWTTSLVTHLRC